jgi:ribosomal-protein-alanine N-acetyltransferase
MTLERTHRPLLTSHTLIRRFRPADLNPILEIERSTFLEDAFPRKMFLDLFEDCPELFLVAEHHGHIVGYMVTCVDGRKAEVVSIAVDARRRNQGVGRSLMADTLAKLKASRVRRVELTVRETNRAAIRFYRRFGFTRLGRIDRYYSDGGDALKMRKAV